MMYTSAEANKLLSKLYSEQNMVLEKEEMCRNFIAATCENIEDVRPDYDFEAYQEKIAELEKSIRTVKHAINVFNVTHVIPGFGITIDQALVYIPQLTSRKFKLLAMSKRNAKRRLSNDSGSNLIEYEYANYDIAAAEEKFRKISDELSRLQNALDVENSTVKFEIDI